jgi:hypothetical protein
MTSTLDAARIFEHVHGHIGWLAAASLVHPAIVLRNRSRRAHLAVTLSTAFVTTGAAIGEYIYVAYRERLKQQIFIDAPSIGLLFERKEHLAFGAVLLAWIGCAAYFAALRAAAATKQESLRLTLRTLAFRAFLGSAALTILVACLGTYVAIFKTF